MRKLPLLLLAVLCSGSAVADSYVRGHTRSDGTYVQPHYRSSPDSSFSNNWSTQGNVNPHTGQAGSRGTPPSNYGSGHDGGYGSSRGSSNSGNGQRSYGYDDN